MKKLVLFVAAMLSVSVASAQSFNVGDKAVSATIGFGSGYDLPIGVSYEQGIKDLGNDLVLGVGGYLGYAGSSDSYTGYTATASNIFIAAQGNVHYTAISKFDVYGGLRLGYNVASASVKWDDPALEAVMGDSVGASDGGFLYSLQVGANYDISDEFAINAELGYGISNFAVGVTYRF